ncbi:hypothetical protein ACJX0J_024335, partial [Zea mays]
ILDEIEANDYDNFTRRAYVPKMKKLMAPPKAYLRSLAKLFGGSSSLCGRSSPNSLAMLLAAPPCLPWPRRGQAIRRILQPVWENASTIHEKLIFGAWLKYEKKEESISDLLSLCRQCLQEFRLLDFSGAIKSAADFQVYEEVGRLRGLDFAYTDTSLYHTKILDEIEANDYDNFTRRAYVPKTKKLMALPKAYLRSLVPVWEKLSKFSGHAAGGSSIESLMKIGVHLRPAQLAAGFREGHRTFVNFYLMFFVFQSGAIKSAEVGRLCGLDFAYTDTSCCLNNVCQIISCCIIFINYAIYILFVF